MKVNRSAQTDELKSTTSTIQTYNTLQNENEAERISVERLRFLMALSQKMATGPSTRQEQSQLVDHERSERMSSNQGQDRSLNMSQSKALLLQSQHGRPLSAQRSISNLNLQKPSNSQSNDFRTNTKIKALVPGQDSLFKLAYSDAISKLCSNT